MAVEIAWEERRPGSLVTPESIDNAITTLLTIGGSTNAIVHVLAMARRAGVPLTLDRFDEISQRVPVLADLRPSGRFLMEDFHHAGGLRGLLTRLPDKFHLNTRTISGGTLGDQLAGAEILNDEVIRTRENRYGQPAGPAFCVAI